MSFLYIKALHIVFVVTWFAGLFYIVRLFIYHTEAAAKPEPEQSILSAQYKIMEKRLWYGITWPSGILTLGFGSYLLFTYHTIPNWLWVKLLFVLGLVIYHLLCHSLYLQLQKQQIKFSSQQLRLWNEVATLFLIAIVFLVVCRNALSMVWGLVGLALFSVVLLLAIRIYKVVRQKSK